METKSKRLRRAALKGLDSENNSIRSQQTKGLAQRKTGKSSDKAILPALVAGREVVGRSVQVFKSSVKEAVWVPGAVKDFDEPNILHKIQYDQSSKEFKETEEAIPEEWLRLSDNRFMWRDDGFVCKHANPTFSLRFTPRREHAVGQRVKVFWTMMGKWYQGKVVDFDASSGKHRVRFKDGDAKPYHIHQEALVWLDIPQLSSGSAIKKTKTEERGLIPIAVISNDENQAPVVDVRVDDKSKDGVGMYSRETSIKKRQPRKSESVSQDVKSVKQPVTRKKAQTPTPTPASKSENEPKSSRSTRTESKIPNVNCSLASGRKGGIGKDAKTPTRAPLQESKKAAMEDVKSASSSSEAAKQPSQNVGKTQCAVVMVHVNGKDPPKHAPVNSKSPTPVSNQQPQATPQNGRTIIQGNGVVTYSSVNGHSDVVVQNGHTPVPGQKRGRAGSVTLAASPIPDPEGPDPKRRALNKLMRTGPGKAIRKQKLVEESRLGSSRRQKTEADVVFEESCRAVENARVGVWWDYDKCFYKGKVTSFDGVRKKLKIHYDDGVDEHIYPFKDDCKFKWLLPRARTAGATDRVHAAFQNLRAMNAKNAPPLKVEVSSVSQPVKPQTNLQSLGQDGKSVLSPTQPIPSTQPIPHTRDGSHLDALVPRANGTLTVPRLEIPNKAETSPTTPGISNPSTAVNGIAVHCGPMLQSTAARLLTPPHTTISTGLSAIISGKTSIPLLMPHFSNGKKPYNGTILGYPQPGIPAPLLQTKPFTSPPASAPKLAELTKSNHPQGSAAEGWKVSIVFRGDDETHSGRIIMYDQSRGNLCHHILWDDGEDEWIDIKREQMSWIEPRSKNTGFAAGLPPGESEKLGHDLVGWHIAVYWKEERQFYEGVVDGYDDELDQYTISYSDGDQRVEPLDGVIFKYVLPATVQTADGSRRSVRQRRTSDNDRDETPPAERRRRKNPRGAQEDDSEEDWGSCSYDRKPFPRHLSITPRTNLWSQQSLDLGFPGQISRCLSGRGSLLCFKGEDVPSSPVGSPVYSPQSSLGLSCLKSDSRSPALVRPLSNVRNAQGFLTNVKRLRIFLDKPTPSTTPSMQTTKPLLPTCKDDKSGKDAGNDAVIPAGSSPAEVNTLPQGSDMNSLPDKLRMMLNRVVLAKQRVEDGMPINTAENVPSNLKMEASSAPLTAIQELDPKEDPSLQPTMANDAQPIEIVLSVSQPQIAEHLTPPPSPFSGFKGDAQSLEEVEKDLDQRNSHSNQNAANNSFNVDQFSMDLPHTPTVMWESHLVAPSRNGSIISGPCLDEDKQTAAQQVVGKQKSLTKENDSSEKVVAGV